MTKIQIIGENGGFLDLKEGTACPITYSIADIKDPSKKKGAFSKTITLSGSKNNNKLLGNIFDINLDVRSFDINKIINCNILVNNIPVLENGIMQLVSINKKQKNGKYDDEITYSVLVKDNVSDFFTQINNKELTDLTGFGWMNHNYTADVVKSTFNNTIKDGFKYIMPFTPEGQSAAEYDDTSLDLTEFSPGIYAKIYFDKIFQNAGYSYSWPTMDDASINFSKLIIPFNGEKPIVNAVEVIDYTAEVKSSTTQTISTRTQNINPVGVGSARYEIIQSTYDRVNMTNEISDPSNRWNSLFSRYNPPNLPSNQNSIQIEYEVDWELITNSFGTAYLKNYNTSSSLKFNVFPTIKMRRAGTAQYLASTNILDTDGNFFKFNDGMFISNGTTVLKNGTSTFTQLAQGIDPAFDIEVCSNVSTSSGWMFKATNNIAGTNRTSTNFGLRITDIRVKIKTMVEGTYGYNVPVDMTRYVPQKVKQSDFIKSIFTMFNLYAEVDKDNPKRINLVSRDKYYDDGKINDWTKKLEKSEAQDIRFIPEISSKSIILTYKEDSDISNKIYKEATGEIYGQQKFTFDNEFIKEEKKQEITFSPTPIFNTKFGAVCPMWLGGAPKCNLRILYDGGELACGPYSIINYRLNSGSSFGVSASSYPYVGHWDKPVNPTFDLNFGVCDYYFRTDNFGSLTNNNLFNLHWRRTLNQINTGKIMTASFNLTETDILNVKLNDKIRIDNSWWNINKIQDFDANNRKPTKVELISIDDNLFIPFQKKRKVRDIVDLSTDLVAIPIRTLTKERNNFLSVNLSSYDIEVKGKYNYILEDVTSATVVGNGNLISANSQVYGNDNIIAAESIVNGNSNIVTEEGGGSIVNGNGVTVDTPSIDTSTINLHQVTSNGATTSNFATFSGGANLSYNISNYVNVSDNVSIGSSLGAGKSNITVDGGYISLGNISGVMGFDPSEVRIMGYTGVGIIGKGFEPAWLQTTSLTTERIIQFPDASGTFSLTSDLTNYVKLSGDQSISGVKTFEAIDLVSADTFQLRGGDETFFINKNNNPFFQVSNGDGFMFWTNPSDYIASFDNNALTANRNYNLPNVSGTFSLTSDLTNYVTLNTTQTITGNKELSNVRLIKKISTHAYPTQSGGNFFIGGNSGYDAFDFYSLDGSDQDSFGVVQIYSNPEEGNNIRHTSLDNNINSIIQINYNDMYFRHQYGGQNTSIYIDGQTDKIKIEGTPNKFAALGTSLITGTKNFEFPNTSGTIALTTDLLWEAGTGTGAIQTPGNNALGPNSLAFGSNNITSGVAAVSMGSSNNSIGQSSFSIGFNNTANSLSETVIGSFGELVSGNATTFSADDTVFRVGIGASTAARKDGFRVYKNGAIKLTPVTTASVTTPTLGMMIFDSTSNDIKIYNGSAWVTVGSTNNMVKQLIIRFTGTTTREVIKDDLGINSSLTINTTYVSAGIINSVQYYRTRTQIVFPSGYDTGKIIVQFENSDDFIGPTNNGQTQAVNSPGYGYIERPNTTTLQLFSGTEGTNSGQRIIGNIVIFNIYP